MKRFLVLVASALAAFLDFAVGCAIAAVVGMVMDIAVPWWHLPIGGVLALLPDFDIIWPILRQYFNRKAVGNHRESFVMHRPLLILPLTTFIAWWMGGTYWATTAFTCVFWHYAHDSKELGSAGLKWFWPFSKRYWSATGPFDDLPSEEHEQWLENTWLKPSIRSVTELCIGTTALCFAIYTSTDNTGDIVYILMLDVVTFVLCGAYFTWSLWKRLKDY